MINLIPLQLDKSTGKVYAKALNIAGGTVQVIGYTHQQSAASAIWNINHNANTQYVMVQIYDENNEVVLPDNSVVVDPNNVTITFSDNQAGAALLLLFSPMT